jgi:hypothetical protein
MLNGLFEKFRPWAEALADLDDPRGEHLLNLDERVRRLEAEVEQLRRPHPADAAAAVTPTSAPERE